MQVMHPEINHNLIDWGMIKNVIAGNNKVILTPKLPFMHVSITKDLIRSIKKVTIEVKNDFHELVARKQHAFWIGVAEMSLTKSSMISGGITWSPMPKKSANGTKSAH